MIQARLNDGAVSVYIHAAHARNLPAGTQAAAAGERTFHQSLQLFPDLSGIATGNKYSQAPLPVPVEQIHAPISPETTAHSTTEPGTAPAQQLGSTGVPSQTIAATAEPFAPQPEGNEQSRPSVGAVCHKKSPGRAEVDEPKDVELQAPAFLVVSSDADAAIRSVIAPANPLVVTPPLPVVQASVSSVAASTEPSAKRPGQNLRSNASQRNVATERADKAVESAVPIKDPTVSTISVAVSGKAQDIRSHESTLEVSPVAGVALLHPLLHRADVSSATKIASAGDAAVQSPGVKDQDQEARTLVASAKVLEVGVASGTHGWVRVRAEMGTTGEVNASVVAASAAHVDALHKDLPALGAYLASEAVGLGAVVVHTTEKSLTAREAEMKGGTFAGSDGRPSRGNEEKHATHQASWSDAAGGLPAAIEWNFGAAGLHLSTAMQGNGSGGWLSVRV